MTLHRPTINPFTSSRVGELVQPEAEHLAAVRTEKPWGHELLYADGRHGYVGKLITVEAGQSLSLQKHERKDETLTVVSGEALFESGPSPESLERTTLLPGDTVHVPAGALHRMAAVTDVVIAEVSTADQGWRTDVVRLEDAYGRTGTTAP